MIPSQINILGAPDFNSGKIYFYNGSERITLFDTKTDTNGDYIFANQKVLKHFNAGGLSNLTSGQYMFYNSGLTEWHTELPNLKNGAYMFYGCSFPQWNIDLPKLETALWMFYRSPLEEFHGDLTNLKVGSDMFRNTKITRWDTPLPNLQNGYDFFWETPLIDFNIDIPQTLTNGDDMFSNYPTLSAESIKRILRTLPPRTNNPRIGRFNSKDWKNDEEIAELLGTTIPITPAEYKVNGWRFWIAS